MVPPGSVSHGHRGCSLGLESSGEGGPEVQNGLLARRAGDVSCLLRVWLRQPRMASPLVPASHGEAAGFWEKTPREPSELGVPGRS